MKTPKAKLPVYKGKDTKTSTRELPCLLTPEEQIAAGKLLTDKLNAVTGLKEDLKRIKDDYKAKMSAIEAEITQIRNKVSSGKEFRQIACTEFLAVPSSTKKEVWRTDTCELVATEEMAFSEMQKELPIETPKAKADDGTCLKEKAKRGRKKKPLENVNILPAGAEAPDDPPVNPVAAALPPGIAQAVENVVE